MLLSRLCWQQLLTDHIVKAADAAAINGYGSERDLPIWSPQIPNTLPSQLTAASQRMSRHTAHTRIRARMHENTLPG